MALKKDIEIVVEYIVLNTDDKPQIVELIGKENMILEKPYVSQGSYIKIGKVEGNKENMTITVQILTADKQSILCTEKYYFKPNVADSSDNFIKQGYEFLKTLPKFADAVDVLEEGQTL